MKLSKRLWEIVQLIPKDKVILDCGTDHGLLPCFCVLNHIASKAYACDNKVGPINKAIKNIQKYQLSNQVITLLQDGLSYLPKDTNVVIIAGMGAINALNIINQANIKQLDCIIVQANKDMHLLRQYIALNNYTILDEKVVFDQFYYEIVVFNTNFSESYDQLSIDYGPINLVKKDPIFIEYLKHKTTKFLTILENNTNKHILNKIHEIDQLLSKIHS